MTTDRVADALADRYRVLEHLGEGGMARVYLAEDRKHQRKVAVKVLRPELSAILGAERFLKEIEVTANLHHPHILPLHDSGEADGYLYYVMPYVSGETLRDKLNREKQLGVETAVEIAKGVAAGLAYAHRHYVIHRDIKPENILLHDGQPVVADFGIALAVSTAGATRLTETGLSLGTPQYMSPEQAAGDSNVTARSDVYSLGAVVYEMLTGDPPHTGSTVQAIIAKVMSAEPQPISAVRRAVPDHLEAAVQTALAKLPADRFAGATEFAEALANPDFARVGARAAETARNTRWMWNRLSATLVAAVVLLLLTTLWGWLRPIPKPVSRYAVALPDGAPLAQDGSRLALSPDGSRFVYLGEGEQGIQLWLREMDELEPVPVPGTSGADGPFFSPDGSHVAFYATRARAWQVAPVDGGPARSFDVPGLTGGTASMGGAWGSDGFVYVSAENRLMRFPENGGTPESASTVDTERGEQAHRWPEPLPGGRGILFSVVRSGSSPFSRWEIAAANLETGSHEVLVRGVRARYAASGHLLYVTADGTLMAVPFDENTLTVTGDPVALVEGLRIEFLGRLDLAVSTTGTLVYTTGGVYGVHRELVWVTRDGVAEPIDPDWTGDFRWPKISPDGRQMVVTMIMDDGVDLWLKQLDQGPVRKLTFSANAEHRPAWSPDGQSVAYLRSPGIYVRRADGAGEAEPLVTQGPVGGVTYSPDGEWVVHTVGSIPNRDIFARRGGADTAVALVATPSDETAPALSPDGRWLAYVSDASGRYDVYVRPFPSPDGRMWRVSADGGQEPVWARSGRELFYKGSSDLMVVEILPGSDFVMGDRRALFAHGTFRGSLNHQQYDVTPDDQRFVMIRERSDGGSDAVIVVENFFEELRAQGRNR